MADKYVFNSGFGITEQFKELITGAAWGRMVASMIARQNATTTLTIASGGTISTTMDARAFAMFGLVIPAAFTSTAVTFKVSADNSTFQALSDSTGTAVSLAVAQGNSYDLPTALAAWPYWQVVAGTAEGAARSLIVVAKG